MLEDFNTAADLLKSRVYTMQVIQKAQPNMPRFHGRCCGTFLTAQDFNTHPCKHTCKDQQECEQKRDTFRAKYPDGREIP